MLKTLFLIIIIIIIFFVVMLTTRDWTWAMAVKAPKPKH